MQGDVGAPEAGRLAVVAAAVEEWKRQLIDLSGRNQLLYYRDLRVGTLRLDDAQPSQIRRLIEGKKVRLSQLFLPTLTDPDRLTNSVKRARAIWKKAQENLEERGIETLFLAVGMATWESTTSSATPNAPILVNTLVIAPRGVGRSDFDLVLTGEWEINVTLAQLLSAEFGVSVHPDPLVEAFEESGLSIDQVGALLERQARSVPSFEARSDVVIGNFAYTKLPMVRDIEESVEFLAENDLISAIAGDPDAQKAVSSTIGDPIDPSIPDRTPPEQEFLILDADSSQSRVVNAVLDGRSVVIQGPPGTGKSQTISNLIATLAARGERVLFVAEKRAAIEAVVKRLDGVGLGHLVMDLHGGISSKRAVAEKLGDSLSAMTSTPQHDYATLHHTLQTNREHLNAYDRSLHSRRDPWELSMFDVLAGLLGVPGELDVGVRFAGRQLRNLTPDVRLDVWDQLGEWAERTTDFRSGVSPWVGATADTTEDAEAVLSLVQDLGHTTTPNAQRELETILDETGMTVPRSVHEWIAVLAFLERLEQFTREVTEDVWNIDKGSALEALEPAGRSWWHRARAQLTMSSYREAKRAVREVLTTQKASGKKALQVVEEAQAISSGWVNQGAQLPPFLPSRLQEADTALEQLNKQLAAFGAYTSIAAVAATPSDLTSRFRDMEADSANLHQLPFIHDLEMRLQQQGLAEFLEALRETQLSAEEARLAFDVSWLESIRTWILGNDDILRGFNGKVHARRVTEFAEADRHHLATSAQRVARAVAESMVSAADAHPNQQSLVRGEARKKTRHRPLRQLLASAPELLLGLRPCWVMSPLVVSQMLPASQLFDVVVFDEASQVLPADAVPALARAPQVVIAGDRHQLPPTLFFASRIDGGAPEEDEDSASAALTQGFESVLDVTSSLLEEYMLTWHYRSEDEKLIAFSNYEIYGGGLTTFPGAGVDEVLSHELIPFAAGQNINTRSNPHEVHRVVDLMLNHAEHRPNESLGVIAMGIEHANRIDSVLEERIREKTSEYLDEFFADNQPERPFVKNLERVQGDERDAIILSIGYSKDNLGRLAMRFGPINQEGGHRRLNVAVTRARRRMTLVSSFTADEVDLSRTGARGVEVMRNYLKYVDSGGTDLSGTRTDISLNPFELSVRDRLETEGIQLVPQYGVSGFRIDFAVRHPEEPGRMLMAIEADGASYHSSPTARDRDRLRQQVLERFGWRFHRIWSTNWFNDREKEVAAVMDSVEKALKEGARPSARLADNPGPAAVKSAPPRRGRKPLLGRRDSIDDYSDRELIQLIQWIMSDTLLRTEDQLLEEAMRYLGFKRRGSKIVRRLTWAIRAAG